ncbi:TonB-dependent receptor [Sphingosinicella soli]|jgi:iron complex outermembrane recepter protein|uniref:Iron complex outermembrane receptor protein n=1 Tax=Sphingosinicella soli TaxID=333708 RepID=A0A7W7AZ97_9SPHN|nr:TonB-dependent receptor [Sphingosinicella soli]MBB4631105.1 iron complex outermembrane receptor protein [Sphingosinicella soli]
MRVAAIQTVAGVLSLTMPVEARAQQQSVEPGEEQVSAFGEIVVTATRRAEGAQDVPLAVTAVSQETLTAAGAPSVRELTSVVPGFNGGRNFGAFQPFIRGIGSTGVTVSDEPSVATYVDGIYVPFAQASNVDLVEIERIEVLRGPQGTTFGRNATGGLVSIVTPDPQFDFGGHADVRMGALTGSSQNALMYDARAYLTGGLSETVAADISVMRRHEGGYVRNLVGSDDFGDLTVTDVRSKLMFRPSDKAKITLIGEYYRLKSQVNAPQPLDGNTLGRSYGAIVPAEPWQVALDTAPLLNGKNYSFGLLTEFDLGAVALETTGGYLHTDVRQDADSDASNVRIGTLLTSPYGRIGEVFSQEVRLLSNGSGPFTWLIGGYAFILRSHNGTKTTNATFGPAPDRPITGEAFTISSFRNTTDSYAAFAEGSLEPSPGLFVTLGARYTTEKRSQVGFLNNNGAERDLPKDSERFNKFTYRGSIRYEIASKTNIYASYGNGFKSGVYTGTITPVLTRPEEVKALEAGIKSDPTRWLRVNLALFHYDYKDLQVTARDPLTTSYVVQNAAAAELYGGELELQVAPSESLQFRAAAAYNHARYKNFPLAQTFLPSPRGGNTVAAGDVSGNVMVRAPKWTFNFGPTWEHELGGGSFRVTGNLFHSSRVYFDFLNIVSQKPYTLVGVDLSWADPSELWRISLFGQNVFNEAVLQQSRVGNLSTDGLYEPPARFGIGISRKF